MKEWVDLNKELGKYGELLSRKYLIDKGYYLKEVNYKNKLGEIDIIVQKDNVIVFIEVKTRKNTKYGLPRESINYKKQMKIRKVAEEYIIRNKIRNTDFRFDVMEVLFKDKKYKIKHIINAF